MQITPNNVSPSNRSSAIGTPYDKELDEKRGIIATAMEREAEGEKNFDPDVEGMAPPRRPYLYTHAIIIGLAMALVVVVESLCVAKLLTEMRLDGGYIRFALVSFHSNAMRALLT
jgi:hypothetical protein